MSHSKVINYVEKLIACTNKEKRDALCESEGKEIITLNDAAHLTLRLVADIDDYFQDFHETAIKLQEMRLAAVIKALPQDVQENIKKKFEEAEDDLLNEDNEGDE